MTNTSSYSYDKAIDRNIGLLSKLEQIKLKNSSVSIAGMGAVGGSYLINLVRMGVENFKIADLDAFDFGNLQRQAGAFLSTINVSKVDAMKKIALDINPNANIQIFEHGVNESSVEEFIKGSDLIIDGIEAFQIKPRRLLHQKSHQKGKFVICSAPIAYGATLQVFDPNGMTFDIYFNIDDSMPETEQLSMFLLGLAPRLLSKSHIDESYVDFESQKGPALASTISLCGGVVAGEALKILLNREKPKCVPHSFYMDPYHQVYIHRTRRPLPFRWVQKILLKIAFKRFPSLFRLYQTEMSKKLA